MPKGSQLGQLKSALAQAGVIGQKPLSKKRKRTTVPLEKEKQKTAAKLEEIHRRLNPFDEKVTRLKHDVGGRKLKGVVGKPAKAKQAGLEQVRGLLNADEIGLTRRVLSGKKCCSRSGKPKDALEAF